MYIGRAVDLRRRVLSYWGDAAEVRGLRRMVAAAARLEALECDSAHEAAWLERNLLERRRARWNRALGGAEVPVWIAVDVDDRRPGVRVVHEHELPSDVAVFGPYLGGTRVRLAVEALHRAAPLAWTGTGITGSERAMGERLGVTPADHASIAALVLAVLAREADAVAVVRATLTSRQDAAADRLDYETAAAIRDELGALAWVVESQRATAGEPVDLEIAGWHDGSMVALAMHDGRLDEWTVRPASIRVGEARAGRTPPEWRAFAERAAILAARLAAVRSPPG